MSTLARGKGNSSVPVAALSQHSLGSGMQFGSLHTDVTDPTANEINAEIGYCHFSM